MASSSSAVNNPNPQNITALLVKMSDADPDFRFMSLNDLHQILTKQKAEFLNHDYGTSARIMDAVVTHLDDQNGEVQNLAVKCIGPLVTKIPISALATMLDKLCTMEIKNAVDNSIQSMALRNAITSLPRPVRGVTPSPDVIQTYAVISRTLIPRILGVSTLEHPIGGSRGILDRTKDPDTEAVDVLIEVVRCFGPLLQPLEVEKLQDVVVQVLEKASTPSPTKKRAVVALAILAPYLTTEILDSFVAKLRKTLQQPKISPVIRRLYISIMGSLARSIPYKFGGYLPQLIEFVLSPLSQEEFQSRLDALHEGNDQLHPEFNEISETALVALESFLTSCGLQMRDYTDNVIAACLRYLKYDPNYAVDEDEEMDETEDSDDEDESDEDDEFEDDVGFDDDDDPSWKVRRCAAKALYTLVSMRSADLLEKGTLYRHIASPLVKRFDEREESVRLEIISTMSLLIRKTGEGVIQSISADEELVPSLGENRKRRRQSSGGFAYTNKAPYLGATGLTSPARESVPPTGPRADLQKLTPQIVKTATKLLKGKQIATKQAIINLLDDLIAVQNGGLADYFDQVMQPIIDVTKGMTGDAGSTSMTLSGSASATATTLRVAVLHFTSDIVKTHSSSLFKQYLESIVAGVVSAVRDRFYKISSEAIRTAEEVVKAITPPRARLTIQNYKPQLQKLYDIILDRASAADADAEVRQKAIQALGTLISRTSSSDGIALIPADKRQGALDLLLDRLRNETTRLHAVRAIDNVAAHSSISGSLEPAWIEKVALELCGQLRKSNRALRSSCIQALQHLILSPVVKGQIQAVTASEIVTAILPVISANDAYLLSPALLVVAQLQLEHPQLVSSAIFIQTICELLKKNVGGLALESIVTLVSNVGSSGMGKPLMEGVLRVGVAGDPTVVGKVVGALFVASGGQVGVKVENFIEELNQSSRLTPPDTARQSLALAVLGEIGLRLGPNSRLQPSIFLEQFHDEPDKVSISAAVALGRAGAGNMPEFLPTILNTIKKPGSQQYLLLQSIREVLHQVVASSADISSYESEIWGLLFTASQTEDNRAICAECIGRLAIMEPKTYIPKLQQLLGDKSPVFRGVAVQALRYTLPDSDESFDLMLKPVLVDMLLRVLKDEDMDIRRIGMTALNSATHNKPDLILPHLGELIPYVITESIIKPELIHEVQMGPFKHLVDDGLEVRKSAYETLYALMETAFSRISSLEFYDRIIAGLNDENDIRSLCNLMLSKLIVIDPEETTRRLDTVAECYRKTLSTKLRDGAVKQEVEKQEEAIKSVLRVTLLLVEKTKTTLPGVAGPGSAGHAQAQQSVQNPVWQQYWEWVNKDFERQLKTLREENKEMGMGM
ncbi:TIP120-domain-containing protein [Annulohypoxylon truncatum]|uniref:TIP120-domain-containing protein n=1 Tax=Annulohypoxylon truncatum TaxID=327061 RepID=UPI0020083FD2|nr:TIP120-domain-containing protein [Annulohypoxylon truncatum]KAI1214570.1 TIP120-domain-containing protein [Annulohypoxylon truncatum]